MVEEKHVFEGWLEKRSRVLGVWRQRWVVLNFDGTMRTFKNKAKLWRPTETLDLKDAKIAENPDSFLIQLGQKDFIFRTCREDSMLTKTWLHFIHLTLENLQTKKTMQVITRLTAPKCVLKDK